MAGKDLISKKTRNELCEYFVGTTLREIETEFDNVDIECDLDFSPNISGQRRTLVHQYYHTLNWLNWSDVRKFVRLYENILNEIEERFENEFIGEESKQLFKTLKKWIEKDGFNYHDGKLNRIGQIDLDDFNEVASEFDIPELHRQIDRARDAIESDPDLAIGTAKEILETTCKTILADHNIEYENSWEIAKLVKETRKVLGLIPNNIPSSAKGADIIQRLLSSLGSTAQGLAELRNMYGTGHGKHGKAKGLGSRHARLAVGASSAISMFFLETHEERFL
jgi:hypothetical protein